jgi:hypothetical protein
MNKEDRSKWLEKKLNAAGMPAYGRASAISRALGCSNAVAQGWLNGSLSKDMELGLRFADQYNFTLREWVYGEDADRGLDMRWLSSIRLAREFEEEFGRLTAEQFILVVELVASDDKGGAFFAENLSAIAKIIK